MNTVLAANNDAVPPHVLKSVAFVDTVIRRWYWFSLVWIYILAYVLHTLPFFHVHQRYLKLVPFVPCAYSSLLDPLLVNVNFCIAMYCHV
jgi:hypothetical protein